MSRISNKVKISLKRSKKIVKDAKVKIIAGDYRGQEGTILKVKNDEVWVSGINLKVKRKKLPQEQETESVVKVEYPIHVSNVQLLTEVFKSA